MFLLIQEDIFYVTPGAIIRFWSTLYLSESISQVVIPTIKYLELYMRECLNINDTNLFYDNGQNIIFVELIDFIYNNGNKQRFLIC